MPRSDKSSKYYQPAQLQLNKEPFSILSLLNRKRGHGFVVTAIGLKSTGKTATLLSLLKESHNQFDEVHLVFAKLGTEMDRFAMVSATTKAHKMTDPKVEMMIYNSRCQNRRVLVVGDSNLDPYLDVFSKAGIVIYRTREVQEATEITIQKDFTYLLHGLCSEWPTSFRDILDNEDKNMINLVRDAIHHDSRAVLVCQNIGQYVSLYNRVSLQPIPRIQAVQLPIHHYVCNWLGMVMLGSSSAQIEREYQRIQHWCDLGTQSTNLVCQQMDLIQSSINNKGVMDLVAANKLKNLLDL